MPPKPAAPAKAAPAKPAPAKPQEKAAAPAAAKPAAAPAKPAAPAAKPAAAAPAKPAPAAAKPAAKPAAAAPKPAAPAAKAPAPETAVKKKLTVEQRNASRAARLVAAQKAQRAKRKTIFKRAEQYTKEYVAAERNLVRMRRQAKNAGHYFVPDEPKVAFVVRIRGINRMAPKTKKILQLLRLRQLNNGVFVKLNKATLNMLNIVEPYITYGTPNLKTVRELLYKRGFGKVDKQRIPLVENKIIEQSLGKFGIICMEDLIHEIYTCGKHFKEANNFLWPFKLSSPLGGFEKKRNHFVEGGDAGNRENYINNLVRQMN